MSMSGRVNCETGCLITRTVISSSYKDIVNLDISFGYRRFTKLAKGLDWWRWAQGFSGWMPHATSPQYKLTQLKPWPTPHRDLFSNISLETFSNLRRETYSTGDDFSLTKELWLHIFDYWGGQACLWRWPGYASGTLRRHHCQNTS